MAILVNTLLEQARHTLVDKDKTYWVEDELLGWYNAAVLAVVAARPDAHAKQVALDAVAGTLQSLPADGLRLIRVIRNEAGSLRPITAIDMALLDRSRPDWHNPVNASEAQHYLYDERDPRNFYLYPGVAAGVKVRLSYSLRPTPTLVADLPTAVLPIDDVYYNPVLDYVLFRGFSKDQAFINNGRARFHLEAFNTALGIKMSADEAIARGR